MASSSSSATNTNQGLDAMELMDIGKTCSYAHCYIQDFLPFSCPCCKLPHCASHWKPDQHACPHIAQAKSQNMVQLPVCPLCHKQINVKAGQDPNLPMDEHLSSACAALRPAGAKRTKPPNECRQRKCRTKMIAPIQCVQCRQSFCPSHRFPQDHQCATPSTTTAAAHPSKGKARPGLAAASTQKAGLAALARARATASQAVARANVPQHKDTAPPARPRVVIDLDDSSDDGDADESTALTGRPASGRAPAPKSQPRPNPTQKESDPDVEVISNVRSKAKSFLPATGQDKRVKAERASKDKALENRAKKGLLTEKEQVQWASIQAGRARSGAKEGDNCIIV